MKKWFQFVPQDTALNTDDPLRPGSETEVSVYDLFNFALSIQSLSLSLTKICRIRHV